MLVSVLFELGVYDKLNYLTPVELPNDVILESLEVIVVRPFLYTRKQAINGMGSFTKLIKEHRFLDIGHNFIFVVICKQNIGVEDEKPMLVNAGNCPIARNFSKIRLETN